MYVFQDKMKHMNKAAKLCIVLAAIICLFSITAYESNTPTKEETLNSSDEYLPPTTNISDSYLNSSADKKENNHHTPSPIHHTTTSYSYDYDNSYDDAIGDDYYYDDAYYDDRYGDSWEYDDE